MSIPTGWGGLKEIMKNRLWKEPVLEAASKKILLALDLTFFLPWVLDLKESFRVLHMSYSLHHTWFTASCWPSSAQQLLFARTCSRCLLNIYCSFECYEEYSNIEFNKIICIWYRKIKIGQFITEFYASVLKKTQSQIFVFIHTK